jgi:hypothetical protein
MSPKGSMYKKIPLDQVPDPGNRASNVIKPSREEEPISLALLRKRTRRKSESET